MSIFPKKFETPYKGEKFVWEQFNKFLPSDYVSYHGYAIDLKETDVILLCPNKGVLILEIKGYLAKNIISVPDNEHIIRKNNPVDLSPFKQARNYMHLLNAKFEKNDLSEVYVVPTVCYPFINKKEFQEKELFKISDEKITFLSEDLVDFKSFQKKMEEIFELAYNTFNRPQLVKNCFNSLNFDKARKLFEGDNYRENENKVEIEFPHKSEKDLYSRLIYINSLADKAKKYYTEIVDDIFAGVEVFFYSKDIKLVESLQRGVINGLSERKLLGNKEFCKNNKLTNNHFYNFGVCDLKCDSFEVKNGKFNGYEQQLELLDKTTSFNYKQYEIEHAPSLDIIVSAGAGTGKTYSLISRINYLTWLNNYSSVDLAKKVVMITFTNDAADLMKKKIQEFFLNKYLLTKDVKMFEYYECVEDMEISTIHSLSKTLLEKFSIMLGLGQNYKIVTGSHVKTNIIKTLVNDYIKENNIDVHKVLPIPNYQLAKKILLLIDKLDNKNIDVIMDKTKFGNSDNPVLSKMFIDIISKYESKIKEYQKENNCVFLSELIKTLKLIVHNKDKLNHFNLDKIDYLIVDEFQDTDDVQIDIMCQFAEVFGYKFFVVGDIKQCIYRFRGAEVKAFDTLREERKLNKILNFTLNKNYRTDSAVLERFNDIFKIWNSEGQLVYSDDDKLISNRKFNNAGIECVSGNPMEKIIPLLKKINKENKDETTAILVRFNYQIDEIKQLCIQNNIKIDTDIGGELFRIDPTIDFYKLVMALKYSSNQEYLYNLYTTAYVSSKLPKKYLNQLSRNNKNLVDYFYDNLPIANWNKYIKDIRQNPVLKVLRELVNEIRPWDNAAAREFIPEDEKEHIRESYMKNLDELFENLLDKANSDYLTLNNISNYLEVMILTSQEEIARNPYHKKSEDSNIICTTVHKSKGLEYDNVILPYCDFDISCSRNKGEVDVITSESKVGIRVKLVDGFSPKDQFQNNYYKDFIKNERKDRKSEETRILYVAMTRTIKKLFYVTDHAKNDCWASLIKGN